MNFDKNRFANFAKYDLTINKAFFRNLAFVTIAGAVGIAMLGFMTRYHIYHEAVDNPWGSGVAASDFEHYTQVYITAAYEWGFMALMMAIFAGCWAHNLRNKQGRITELTLPATNLEKFTWHALLMLVGGFLLSFVALLIADGFNALLTLMMFGAKDGVGSLTQTVGEIVTFTGSTHTLFNIPTVSVNGEETEWDVQTRNLVLSCSFLVISSFVAETIIFFFGNALKYKYNIILTYIAMQVIGTIISILFFIVTAVTAGDLIENMAGSEMEGEDVANFITGSFVTLGVASCLLSVLLIWWSYRRYTKAQITTSFNK